MIGVGTLLRDNPLLTVRYVKGKSPIRVIVDGSARTPPASRMFSAAPRVIVAVTNRASRKRVERLRRAGAHVLTVGKDRVNLRTLLTRLHRMGIRSILLEGGGGMNWSMISNRLVDKINLTVAPIIIGGNNATTLVDGEGIARIKHAISLLPLRIRREGNEILLSFKVK